MFKALYDRAQQAWSGYTREYIEKTILDVDEDKYMPHRQEHRDKEELRRMHASRTVYGEVRGLFRGSKETLDAYRRGMDALDRGDYSSAWSLLSEAVSDDDWYRRSGGAYLALGDMLWYGMGMPCDKEKALEYYEKATWNEYYDRAGIVAEWFFQRKDYYNAAIWYGMQAENGDRDACLRAGELYFYSDYGLKDYDKAKDYLTRGAELGSRESCYVLGKCYAAGGHKEALYWISRGKDYVSEEGAEWLGDRFVDHDFGLKGLEGDVAAAFYRYAASEGNERCRQKLLRLYKLQNAWPDRSGF